MDGSMTGPNTTKQLIIFSGFPYTYEKRCNANSRKLRCPDILEVGEKVQDFHTVVV